MTVDLRRLRYFVAVAVPQRGLRPRTPSSVGSLALARPTGDQS
jgi:hypothetical protein